MNERREFPRAPLTVLLEIWSGDKKRSLGKGFITNLSEGGLALETSERLKLKDRFLLRFTLPNDWNFDLWGEIVYIKEGILTKTYGIQFHKMVSGERVRIKHYVKANLELDKCS
jgi:hypothetical protein